MATNVSAPDLTPWRLAQTGDPDAIAALINRSLRTKGVKASATVQAECLRLTLRSNHRLDPDRVVPWLQDGLARLNLAPVQRVEIAAWIGQELAPDWNQAIALAPPSPPPRHAAPSSQSINVNIQARDISSPIVVGNHNTVVGPGGNLVVNRLVSTPRPKLKPIALRDTFKPPAFPNLLDRNDESQQIAASLQRAQSVECFSDRGWGKTALLQSIAHRPAVVAQFPDGVLYLRARRRPFADLLQALFDAFYATDIPCKPTEIQIRRYLKGKRALVIVDDLTLDAEEAQDLLSDFPDLTFLWAAKQQRLWGAETAAIPLQGLPLEDAVALVERALARHLNPGDRQAVEALCIHLQQHPLRLLQAAGVIKQKRLAIAPFVQRVIAASSPEQVSVEVVRELSTPAKRIVAVLALLGGIPLQGSALADVAGTSAITAPLAELQELHWILFDGLRYRLAENLIAPLQPFWSLSEWLPRLTTVLGTWIEQQTPELVAQNSDAILQVMELVAQAGQQSEVLRLGQSLESSLRISYHWGAWDQVLQLQLQAAQAVGDRTAEALALHQLGSRSLCLGDVLTANRHLTAALDLRESLGDQAGAELTRHNLDLLYGSLELDPDPPLEVVAPLPPPTSRTPSPGLRYARWGAIAAPILAGAISVWVFWPRTAQLGISPERLSFADTELNDSAEQTLTLSNPGRTAISFTSGDFTLTGQDADDFAIAANSCIELVSLAPEEDCTVTLQFLPQQEGDRTAQLLVQYAHNREATIPLRGVGTPLPLPNLRADPGQLTFNRQNTGSSSDPQALTLVNEGDAPLTLRRGDLTLAGSHPDDFALGQLCPGRAAEGADTWVIAPGDRCRVEMTFQPQASGDRAATLTLQTEALPEALEISLTGVGIAVPQLTLSPPRLSFDRQPVGSQSEYQSITLTSSGTGPVTIEAVTLSSPDFVLGRHDCEGIELAPEATCTIPVAFAPQASAAFARQTTGDRQAQLQIQSNATDSPQAVTLFGEADRVTPTPIPLPTDSPTPTPTPTNPPVEPPPEALIQVIPQGQTIDFEYTAKIPQSVVVRSRGEAALTLGNIGITGPFAKDFEITSNSCSGQTLTSPNESCEVQVQFAPVSSDARVNAELMIPSNATASTVAVELWGSILQ